MSKLTHRFSVFLAFATLFLIFAGGLVTSNDAGLSVPDWPLSYGTWMPPMVGGIFFEHGHRMIAATVGFCTIILAGLITWKEDRGWVKKTAWMALGLVILQGVLGGMTVLFLLPKPISIGHACLAQTFFCLVVSIAVWTSSYWRNEPALRVETEGKTPLHRIAAVLFGASFVQLILGAILRHTGRVLPLHIGGAVLILIFTIIISTRSWNTAPTQKPFRLVSSLMILTLTLQIALGVSSFFLLRHQFDTIPPPFYAPLTITLHVATGALFLALTVIFFWFSFRTKPALGLSARSTLSDYLTLTKPGISLTAAITALAGYLLGSKGHTEPLRLLHTSLGTLLTAAGAGTLNMLIERETDALMNRTKTRPLPSGRLPQGEVFFFGALLCVAGVLYLSWTVNLLTAVLASLTMSVYLYLYTPLKKYSNICVFVGAISGALPPVMGWTAATGRLSIEPISLFGILFFWQFPHFLSLAWLYKEDYSSAGLRMLPMIGKNDTGTAWSVLLNSVALLAVSCLPTFWGLTGPLYLAVAVVLGAGMTFYSLRFFLDRTRPRAKQLFFFSLAYIPLLVLFMIFSGPSKSWL